jgi:hypothetical protein
MWYHGKDRDATPAEKRAAKERLGFQQSRLIGKHNWVWPALSADERLL